MSNKKTKLSLEIDGKIISVEFDHIDVDLDDYFQALKTLVIGATFTEKQYNYWIIEEGDALKDEEALPWDL